MKYQALTLKASTVARSIFIPVVIAQSRELCQKFGVTSQDADVLALVDTGATTTAVSDRLAAGLGLKAVAQCKVSAAGGVHISNVYSIDVLLRSMVTFANIEATEFVFDGKFDVILGMDVLMLGDLAITNADHKTVLSFRVPPDDRHIDYVAMAAMDD